MKRVGIDYEYYVKANGKKEWKNHDWILDNHPRELALFYEKNVIFEGDWFNTRFICLLFIRIKNYLWNHSKEKDRQSEDSHLYENK